MYRSCKFLLRTSPLFHVNPATLPHSCSCVTYVFIQPSVFTLVQHFTGFHSNYNNYPHTCIYSSLSSHTYLTELSYITLKLVSLICWQSRIVQQSVTGSKTTLSYFGHPLASFLQRSNINENENESFLGPAVQQEHVK